MSLTSTQFMEFFPAFESKVSESVVDFWITHSCEFVDPDKWGDKCAFAQALIVAHNLQYLGVSEDCIADASSALKRDKVGDIEVEYQNESSSGKTLDGLDATPYGRQFKALRRTLVITPMVASGSK